MATSELDYLKRREAQERASAERAAAGRSKAVHEALADAYASKVTVLRAARPVIAEATKQ